MGRFTIVGIGPGTGAYLLPLAAEAIGEADVLAGARRHLEPYEGSGKRLLRLDAGIDDVLDEIASRKERERVALLLSGDPCLYSLLGRAAGRFSQEEYRIIPGVSSFQLFFARLGIPWSDVLLESLHGRPLERAADMMREDRKTLFFLDPKNTASSVAAFLVRQGFPDRRAWLAERLGYDDERIVETTLFGASRMEDVDSLSLMLADEGPLPPQAVGTYPDDWFVRTEGVPLSGEAVRSLAVSSLFPLDGASVLEVGAGSGGITVELARRVGRGTVYAVERRDAAIVTVRRNLARAGAAHRVRLIAGNAPDALDGIPAVRRAVVGGHGGAVEPILERVWELLLPGGRLVVTANMPSTADRAFASLRKIGSSPRALHLSVSSSREAGTSWMLIASNPVFLVIADKEGNANERP